MTDTHVWMALILAGGLLLISSHARGADVHIGAEVVAIEDVNPAAYCERYQCDEITIEQEDEQGEVFDVPYVVVVME